MSNARKTLTAGCVVLTVMLFGIGISGCASPPSYTYAVPSQQDIGQLIMEWNDLERRKNKSDLEFTAQYAKALKALSDAIAESERWRARAEDK